MEILKTTLNDCFIIKNYNSFDERGIFSKTIEVNFFKKNHLNLKWEESFLSINKKDVIRGLHFQIPPFEHFKLVTCIQGSITDVVLDIRKESTTYGKFFDIKLSADKFESLYIPPGFAHGFLSLEADTIVNYMVSKGYSKDHDMGIFWNSISYVWDVKNPIISKRDLIHPKFESFISPF